MDTDELLEVMKEFARSVPADEMVESTLEARYQANDAQARDLVLARLDMLTERDREDVEPYLCMDLFMSLEGDLRRAAWLLGLEMATIRRRLLMRERFERYVPSQPLLQALPVIAKLIRDDQELVSAIPELKWRTDGVIHYQARQLRLDPDLPTSIPSLLRTKFPDVPLFVRLDPMYVRQPTPVMRLDEAVIIPADPTWWHSLHIHRGQVKGAHYIIETPVSPVEDLLPFWDYKVCGIRSLEVHAQRPKDNYLSMMVEEIQDRRELDGQVIGRCIHLDTDAPIGSDPSTSTVKHLDLAINVYEGMAGNRRLDQGLANGRVVDASFRTHLLRVENIPMNVLLGVAPLFFRSQYLLAEWFSDQFSEV